MESTFLVFLASIIIVASWPKIPKMVIFCVWGAGGVFPFIRNNNWLSAKNSKKRYCDTFWVRNTKKKSWKNARYYGSKSNLIIGQISWKKYLEHLWYLWPKSQLFIDQKTRKMLVVTPFAFKIPQKGRKNAQYYRRVLHLRHLLGSKLLLIISLKSWMKGFKLFWQLRLKLR